MIAAKTLGVMAWFATMFFILGPWLVLRASDSSFADGLRHSSVAGKAALVLATVVLTVQVVQFVRLGRGTPAPFDPPQAFVAVGPYRYSRNPMYLLYVAVMLTEAWAFACPALVLYAAGFFALTHFFVTKLEEPGLRRRFGQSYEAYAERVPRWLW
ncbi:MAG: isoprenylcysteine carboxylmethyltransferase family protein [bacterium]|nr:isoprenylcysteine carboxylmethyltransferase family protein [bacterium]MCP5069888.1 isoprenylcysteine carboxylmethyltransferase family protein [bacterium]